MLINVSASSWPSAQSQFGRGLEPSLRSESPSRLRRERESSLETYHRPTEMQDFCEKENLAIAVERALPGLCAGELHAALDQTSGTLVGELCVVLVDRRAVVVGMMNQDAWAECRIKPNDKLQGAPVK